MKPNKKFDIDLRELQIIEGALHQKLHEQLNQQRSYRNRENQIQTERAINEIRNLLGSLHNQKTWFRPRGKIYISG